MTDREATAADRAVLISALRCDPEVYLRDLVDQGADFDTIRRDIHARTGGMVDMSDARVVALVEEAMRSRPGVGVVQVRADRDLIEKCLGSPAGPFFRDRIAAGDDARVIARVLADLTRGAVSFGPARIGRLIQDERERGGPYIKPEKPVKAMPPTQAHESRPRVRARRSAANRPAPAPAPAPVKSKPSRPASKSLYALEAHLDQVLGSPSRAYLIKHLKIGKSKGTQEKQLFNQIAESLRAKGARADLNSGDFKRLAQDAGWETDKQRAKAAADSRERRRRDLGLDSRDGQPRGFWAGISNERYVRPVNGGLPGLGKRR
ncbi:hypothetical protein [Cellulomonas sp.]|uniref:hypothetical protein n=1 Tax=Cellulomonas sp. TaxID=40001 RepID=UPI003BAD7485